MERAKPAEKGDVTLKAPMTLDQRDKVMDAIIDALSNCRADALAPYTLTQLIDAVYLTVALEYYNCLGRPDPFRETVKHYSGVPWQLEFLSDRFSLVDPKTREIKPEFAHAETVDSFAEFCIKTGHNAVFWETVYARVGMAWHDGLPYFEHPPAPRKPTLWERLFK